jgi:hypothetical protein
MTPLLLTLASLTPGDGGPGGGAAQAPVTVTLGDGFKGYIRLPDGPLFHAKYAGGRLSIEYPGQSIRAVYLCTLTGDGQGGFRLTWAGATFRGAVSPSPRGLALTLHPTPLQVDPLRRADADHLPNLLRLRVP